MSHPYVFASFVTVLLLAALCVSSIIPALRAGRSPDLVIAWLWLFSFLGTIFLGVLLVVLP